MSYYKIPMKIKAYRKCLKVGKIREDSYNIQKLGDKVREIRS